MALSISLISAGAIGFILSQNMIGTLLLFAGIIVFAIKSKQEIYELTGSRIKRNVYYFDREVVSKVEKIINGEFAEGTPVLPLIENGNGKMEVIMSEDKEFISVQLFHFVPHKYEETTDHIIYSGKSAKRLIECIERSRKK